ncbi:ATP synthase F1 subunit epsilon [Rhizomicrobium electricum]|uniref:ATP synthase epsilon chain n=1 Tax=Rhizomicrobium electricum TaxID=480070 RepID=A0ABN1DYZ7_9PROT|nr:ATP synthase F1 subunit epsilon [Rhizomicrobium electricum]NIJ47242.1 F-type H+-transporting ATPase subunit epsilon [Rhizomicrobium electricum]
MADKISFDLVSPEQLLLSADADMVTIPGSEGDMGVMAGHTAVITTLRPGVITVSGGKEAQRFFVLGGFAEVTQTKLTVLAEEAIPANDIDARIAAVTESLAKAVTDTEKSVRQAKLDTLTKLRADA